LKRPAAFLTGAVIAIIAAAAVLGAAGARPAQALPSYKQVCSDCHTATPVGTVTATPSKTTLTPGEAYTVNVAVNLSAAGQTGYWIVNNDAGTPDPNKAGGPAASPLTANMTAPATAGTYTYKVYGVKSPATKANGQVQTTTYQITVSGGGGGGALVQPTVAAPSPASVRKGKVATLMFRVDDANAGVTTATATIKIRNAAKKVVKALKVTKPVNGLQSATFTCKLAKGKYKFTVTAKDTAGLASSNSAVNKLTVK
jgi:hypothetical protein